MSRNTEQKYDIHDMVLGGLLHDIGKLHMKGGEDGDVVAGLTICKEHPIISAAFVERHRTLILNAGFNVDAVKEIVQRHHENKNISEDCDVSGAKSEYKKACLKVSRADNYSSSERVGNIGELEGGNPGDNGNKYRTRTLASVFSSVSPDGLLYSHKVGDYSSQITNISNSHRVNTYETSKKFIEEFDSRFAEIKSVSKTDFIDKVNSLLHDYSWCFPSDVKKIYKDVSLYSHLKTTAAIAQMLYACGTSTEALESAEACLMQIQIVNEAGFITSNHANNTIIGVEALKKNEELLSKLLSELVKEIKVSSAGLTDCNIIAQNKFNMALIVPKSDIEAVEKTIQQKSKQLSYMTDLACYIKYAYDIFNVREFSGTADNLHNVRRALYGDVISGVQCVGLENILTNNGHWSIDIGDRGQNVDYTEDNKTQSLSNNTYAMVKVTLSNIEQLLVSMLNINRHRILNWAKNPDFDQPDDILKYGSVSRVSTVYETVSNLLRVESWLNCINIHQNDDSISFVMKFDDFVHKFYTYLEMLTSASAGSIQTITSVQTFKHSDDIEQVYSRLSDRHNKLVSNKQKNNGKILYNSVIMTLEDIKRMDTVHGYIVKSSQLAKAPLYKSVEFIRQYKRSLKTHEVCMCIPRFSYTQARTFNDGTIDKNLNNILSDGFKQLQNGKRPSSIFMVLDTLITDTI